LAFNEEVDYVNLLDIILTNMMELTHSDAGTLYILEDDKLYFRILKNKSLGLYQIAKPDAEIDLPPIPLNITTIDNVAAFCAVHNEVVIEEDIYESTQFNFSGPKNYDKLTGYRTRSMLTMPLSSSWEGDQEVLGVIQLLNATDPVTGDAMSYDNSYPPQLVMAVAKIATNTLANLTHMQEIHQLFHSFVAVMTQGVDERSPYTRFHSQNVSKYCSAFAEYMASRHTSGHPYYFSKNHRERLAIAATLHDIGKIITPQYILDKAKRLRNRQIEAIRYRFQIKRLQLLLAHSHEDEIRVVDDALNLIEEVNDLNYISDELCERIYEIIKINYEDSAGIIKPILTEDELAALSVQKGTLSPKERAIIQEHVSVTGRLLDKVTFWKYYKGIAKWARDHHEFLDGTGYPQGLYEDEINFETRIITIMDIFDALTADNRPYRKSMPPTRAMEILQEMAKEGKLDKRLVQMFYDSRLWEKLVAK